MVWHVEVLCNKCNTETIYTGFLFRTLAILIGSLTQSLEKINIINYDLLLMELIGPVLNANAMVCQSQVQVMTKPSPAGGRLCKLFF